MAIYTINSPDDYKKLVQLADAKQIEKEEKLLHKIQKQTFEEDARKILQPLTEQQEKSTKEIVEAIEHIEPSQITNIYNPIPAIEPQDVNQGYAQGDLEEIQGYSAVDKFLSDGFAVLSSQPRQPGFEVVSVGGNKFEVNQTPITLKDGLIIGRDFEINATEGLIEALKDRFLDPSYLSKDDQRSLYFLLKKVGYKSTGHPPKRLEWFKNYSPIEYETPRQQSWSDDDSLFASGFKFLSSDPNELVERLMILIAEQQGGNDNILNEATAILDELSKQKEITEDEYYKIFQQYLKT